MTNPFLILLPPSEGKASGGDGPPLDLDALSFEELNKTRAQLINSLAQLSGKPRVAQKTLGVKGAALEIARTENSEVMEAATLPAIDRYTGVMYDAIDSTSLSETEKDVFGSNTIIMSGLFGLLRPFDLIPAYKLKMGAKLRKTKNCAAVWKPLVTKSLATTAEGGVIWDLLPNEHSAALDPSKVRCDVRHTVKFLEAGPDGALKTVSHWSKALKGALVRHLVANPDQAGSAAGSLELLAAFNHPEGYQYSPELTEESDGATEIIFLKND